MSDGRWKKDRVFRCAASRVDIFFRSGRNAGHCTPTFTHFSLPELRRLLGEPWAERLIARQTRANDRVSSMIRRYQIQCEWQQNGYVMGAPYPGAMKTIPEYSA